MKKSFFMILLIVPFVFGACKKDEPKDDFSLVGTTWETSYEQIKGDGVYRYTFTLFFSDETRLVWTTTEQRPNEETNSYLFDGTYTLENRQVEIKIVDREDLIVATVNDAGDELSFPDFMGNGSLIFTKK
jgi:hypothetical protein